MNATTEHAFELYIQETLAARGWLTGDRADWDKQRAIFPEYVIAFLKATQPALWAQMEQLHGAELPAKLTAALLKERDIKGTLDLLRHGFKFYGKTFKIAYFKPAHGLSPDVVALYDSNRLHVTRQIPCHPNDTKTVDLLLSLNGLPVATIELKNPATGQTWRDAVAQYQADREPGAPLFRYKNGAVAHFAVDPDEIHMATRLNRDETVFLPFNRGSHPNEIICGKGNPAHPSGHRAGYFFEETLERESFLDIAGHFMFLDTREETVDDGAGGRKRVTKETLVFPRYHQLDCVRRLVKQARLDGAGQNYLIQHSAGSGKTNSISWLSHRLASLHTANDEKVFDCVIVVTDRRVLDKQLQDAIYQIEHAQGVVKAIDQHSRQLAEALVDGTKIVITTLQKFPEILRALLRIAGADNPDAPDAASLAQAKTWEARIAARSYAVIVDEAHSSQSGDAARELKRILGAEINHETHEIHEKETENGEDWEDNLNAVMASRGRQKNVSFFAFTATPKGKTLELFGRPDANGVAQAFHTYSMKQAIEEGFILDVLQRYTTYKTYYQLVKTAADDPAMQKKKAAKKLAKFMILHPYNIAQKTEIIIEHFRQHVRHKLGGRAKAMVVAGSRLHAVRYKLAFEQYLADNHYADIRPLVAFSGEVLDPDSGEKYTEPGMNTDVVSGKPISEAQLPDKFDSSDYHILLVANKYQTGFDQPRLCAMYVDRRLDGVQAVQTLSRLNRIHAGKDAPFVLDFVNEADDIYMAFKPYYNVTTLHEAADPALLEQLKHELNAMQVYLWSEVEGFCRIFYLPKYKQQPSDHAQMEKMIQPARDRFKALPEETQEAFYEKLSAYASFYAFVSQILPYSDTEWEMLYGFGSYLLTRLPFGEIGVTPHPEKEVALEYYRLEQAMSGAIVLEDGEQYGVSSPTAVGTGKATDEDKPLSEIIAALNERFGTEFSEEDRLFLEQIKEKAAKDERVIQTAQANSLDKFELGVKAIIEALMLQRLAENDRFVTRYMDEYEFQKTVFPHLAQEIYRLARERQPENAYLTGF